MDHIPTYLSLAFLFITILSIGLLLKAFQFRRKAIYLIAAWAVVITILGLQGFYANFTALPPRIVFLVLPPLAFILYFVFVKGGNSMASLSLLDLTWIHAIRVPVELGLWGLAGQTVIPELMTFEGRNFDIVAGLTAPIMAIAYSRGWINRKVLMLWNFLCLALLFNIVFHGILSAPSPFQRFAFEQPNVALVYFPYFYLPGIIVPIVLFSHLASIKKLMQKNEYGNEFRSRLSV